LDIKKPSRYKKRWEVDWTKVLKVNGFPSGTSKIKIEAFLEVYEIPFFDVKIINSFKASLNIGKI